MDLSDNCVSDVLGRDLKDSAVHASPRTVEVKIVRGSTTTKTRALM